MHGIIYLCKILFIYLLKRWEGREKEKERNINVWLPLIAPSWGPGLQPRLNSGNALVHRLVLSPLSHSSQGQTAVFKRLK